MSGNSFVGVGMNGGEKVRRKRGRNDLGSKLVGE